MAKAPPSPPIYNSIAYVQKKDEPHNEAIELIEFMGKEATCLSPEAL
jgi:hypothetical protein